MRFDTYTKINVHSSINSTELHIFTEVLEFQPLFFPQRSKKEGIATPLEAVTAII